MLKRICHYLFTLYPGCYFPCGAAVLSGGSGEREGDCRELPRHRGKVRLWLEGMLSCRWYLPVEQPGGQWVRRACQQFRHRRGTYGGWQSRRGCAVLLCFHPGFPLPGGRGFYYRAEAAPGCLLVSSKEQKILGLSNHRTGDYSFPINAANTSSNFHLILICSASYTRTCSTKIRSSSLVSVFASLY